MSLFATHQPAPVRAEKLVGYTKKVISFTVKPAVSLLWPLSNRAVFAKGELLNIHFNSTITKVAGITLGEGISRESVQHLCVCDKCRPRLLWCSGGHSGSMMEACWDRGVAHCRFNLRSDSPARSRRWFTSACRRHLISPCDGKPPWHGRTRAYCVNKSNPNWLQQHVSRGLGGG